MTEKASTDQSGPRPGFTLLGDRPYSGPQDPLGFDQVVDGLATLILDSRDSTPFTLGIEGSWGSGKSSLMTALLDRLEQEEKVTAVSFNAWTAEDGRVLEGFVKTVLNQIDPNILRRTLRNEKALRWARALVTLGAGPIGLSSVVDKVWDRASADPQARNELRGLIEEAVKAWRDQTPDPGDSRVLCIFVDDLDRCYPKVVLEVLEAMKLYLDVPGIVFVIGYDEDIVSGVVLRDKGYGDKTEARGYLEKFIQISYRIPRADDQQSEALLESLLATSRVGILLGGNERQLVVERSGWNPRRIKRFINNFVLVHGLDPRLRELAPQSLVRVLLLQMYFPQVARLLERSSERDPLEEFIEYEEARTALLRQTLQGAAAESVEKALKSHGLAYPGALAEQDPDELLRRLEKEVRVEFPPLAGSREFAGLIQSIVTAEDWPLVRAEVSRGALASVEHTEPESTTPLWLDRGFHGLRVAWIDEDHTGENARLAETMMEGGASLETVSDMARLRAILQTRELDVLVSDIGRDRDPMAGFRMLEEIYEDPELHNPYAVIFFTGRMTPIRMEKAKELGAEITTDGEYLMNFIASRPRDER